MRAGRTSGVTTGMTQRGVVHWRGSVTYQLAEPFGGTSRGRKFGSYRKRDGTDREVAKVTAMRGWQGLWVKPPPGSFGVQEFGTEVAGIGKMSNGREFLPKEIVNLLGRKRVAESSGRQKVAGSLAE